MLYEESGISGRRLKVRDVAQRFRPPVGEARVSLALQHLQSIGLVSGSFDNFSASGFLITRKGLLSVEERFDHVEVDGNSEFRVKGGVPAADRIVPLDHNDPNYRKIEDGLAEIREALRGQNDLDVSDAERDRLIASVSAAQNLWASAELKLIQVKVGVLMAVEDAQKALTKTARAVAGALIVDMIKAFVKSHTGLDLDHI